MGIAPDTKLTLTSIFGKAASITAIAAAALAYISAGQVFDLIPGNPYTDSYSPNVVESVINKVSISHPVSDRYQPQYYYEDGGLLDSHLSLGEGFSALGISLVAGGLGVVAGKSRRNQVMRRNDETLNSSSGRFSSSYKFAEAEFLHDINRRYSQGSTLDPDDLGRLSVMPSDKIDALPDFMRRQVASAHTDIAGWASKLSDGTVNQSAADLLSTRREKAQTLANKLYPSGYLQQTWRGSSSSSSRSSSSDNFWLGYVVGSSNSSSPRSSSSSSSNNKDAGAALGAILLVGAAVGASILAGYSTWLNFGPAPQPLPPQGEKAKILANASDVIAKARGEILKPIAI